MGGLDAVGFELGVLRINFDEVSLDFFVNFFSVVGGLDVSLKSLPLKKQR